jgi:hypothetical protein
VQFSAQFGSEQRACHRVHDIADGALIGFGALASGLFGAGASRRVCRDLFVMRALLG